MLISTRGRYALRVMTQLARTPDRFVPMKDVASDQDISLKYLEQILPVLVKAGLLEGIHGKSGGYRLTRAPEDYRVGEILRLTEGSLSAVSCPALSGGQCTRGSDCPTLPVWERLNCMIADYLDNISLAELISGAGE